MDRPRVLVVEDRPSVLKLMATILETGYEVTTATDGAKALALIGEVPVDVVLSDIRMPGATGFEVLRTVKRRSPGTAVVLMTAYANIPDAVEAMRQGATDYVAKPLDADEISLVIARAVDRRRLATRPAPLGPTNGHRPAADEASRPVLVEFHRAIEEARNTASSEYLARLLRAFRGNVTHAARQAGMTRESLHRVLKKYGVRVDDYRSEGCGDPATDGGHSESA